MRFRKAIKIRFELETENNEVLPKRSRRVSNGLTELIIRTGQALLIRSDLEKTRERLGVVQVGGRAAKCFCGAPIMLGGRPAGAMVAMNTEHEYVFQQRDLEVMQTAAGQLSVAVENARLFAEELRRSKQLSFLNNISKMAISSEDAEQMLADIVAEIQKTSSSTTSASAFSTTSPKKSKSGQRLAQPPRRGASASPSAPESWAAWHARMNAPLCRMQATAIWSAFCPTRAPCSASRSPTASRCWAC